MRASLRAELRSDGVAPIAPEAAVGDADADRRLPALVFVDLDQARHALHIRRRITGRDDLVDALVLLHVALQDGVQHLVWRQTVLVLLVEAQLGRRRPRDDALRD